MRVNGFDRFGFGAAFGDDVFAVIDNDIWFGAVHQRDLDSVGRQRAFGFAHRRIRKYEFHNISPLVRDTDFGFVICDFGFLGNRIICLTTTLTQFEENM